MFIGGMYILLRYLSSKRISVIVATNLDRQMGPNSILFSIVFIILGS